MPKSCILGTTFLETNKSCIITLSFQIFKGLLYLGCVETSTLASSLEIRFPLGGRKERGKDGTQFTFTAFKCQTHPASSGPATKQVLSKSLMMNDKEEKRWGKKEKK